MDAEDELKMKKTSLPSKLVFFFLSIPLVDMQLEGIILVTLLNNATNYNNTQKIAFVKPPRRIGYIFGFTVFACLTQAFNRQFTVILSKSLVR